jgi:hypothetical protein
MTPDEEIKNPYLLEFLGLKDEYSTPSVQAAVQHNSEASHEWLASDVLGFFGVANRFSIDLRAKRYAFIADENATLLRRAPHARAASFNEAPHVVVRLTAERIRQLVRRSGWGDQLRSESIPIRETKLLCDDLNALAMRQRNIPRSQ